MNVMLKASIISLLAVSCLARFTRLPKHFPRGGMNLGLYARGLPLTTVGQAFKTYDQTVDHFSTGPRQTFKQRYLVNTTGFAAGGPVYLIVGGEGPLAEEYVSGHFVASTYAYRMRGMVVALEHRGYGESYPNGDPKDMTNIDSTQALQDLLEFKEWFSMTQLGSYTTSPWIIVGGSYSGALAAWLMQAAEQSFAGALASSAPVVAQNFPQYFDVAMASFAGQAPGGSPQCATLISQGLQATVAQWNAGNLSGLTSVFKTCSPLRNDGPNELASFLDALTGYPAFVVQYNNDNRGAVNNHSAPTVAQVCQVALQQPNDPLQSLAAVNTWLLNQFGATCVDARYADALAGIQEAGADRSWTYQTCNEFSFFQYGDGTGPYPVPTQLTLAFYTALCQDAFGIDAQTTTARLAWTNVRYGERMALSYIARTFLANGKVDPWHYLGVNSTTLLPVAGPRMVATRLMEATAHCADMYQPAPTDPAELTQTRADQLAAIAQYIAHRW